MLSFVLAKQKKSAPLVMGVLNVTPDSFSDGGEFYSKDRAIEHALKMVEFGADIIDVGGESTRPRSESVTEKEELDRVIPVIERLKRECDCPISVDTTKPVVAKEAVRAGAGMINDISMLRYGIELARVAAEHDVELVLMHSRKSPKDMQEEIKYDDVVADVARELIQGVERAVQAGCKKEKIWLDPGIGFAKTAEQSIELLARLDEIVALGYPVLVGPSRKSFIGAFTEAEVGDRLGGTAAAVAISIVKGARAVRVHDVAIMRQAALIAYNVEKKLKSDRLGKRG